MKTMKNPTMLSVFLLLSQFLLARSQSPSFCNVTKSQPLIEPVTYVGEKSIEVRASQITVGCVNLTRRLFNGGLSGPTLRFDYSNVSGYFVSTNNFLENTQTDLNSLSLHFQAAPFGVPSCSEVSPGGKCNFFASFRSEGGNLFGGTFLYQSKEKGLSQFQVESGLSGMFIYEDDISLLPPPLNNRTSDVILLFQPLKYSSNASSSFSRLQEKVNDDLRLTDPEVINWLENPHNGIDFITVNGQVEPVLELTLDECKRFRLGNAASIDALVLQFNTTACRAIHIARGGFYLREENISSDGMLLLPGETAEWLFSCQHEGVFEIRSNSSLISTWNYPVFDGRLLTIEVTAGSGGQARSCPQNFTAELSYRTPEIPDEAQYDVGVGGPPNITLSSDRNLSGMIPMYSQTWNIVNKDPIKAFPLSVDRAYLQVLRYNDFTGPCFVCTDGMWELFSNNCTPCQNQFHQSCDASRFTCSFTCNEGFNHVTASASSQPGYARADERRYVILVPPVSNISVYVNFRNLESDQTTRTEIESANLAYADQGSVLTIDIAETSTSSALDNQKCNPLPPDTTTSCTTSIPSTPSPPPPPPPPTCDTRCIVLCVTLSALLVGLLATFLICQRRRKKL